MNNYSKLPGVSKADVWFQKAFMAHQSGKLEEAEALYRRVLRKTPADMETLYLLGTLCSQLGKHDEGIKYFKKALEIDPDHPEALNNAGLALIGLDRSNANEAAAYYRHALALRPDYADAHSNLGGALELLGQLDEAETHLRMALELNPDFANAYYNLGLVLKAKDHFAEAAQCFLRGLELKTDKLIEAYIDLGSIYKMWGRNQESLDYFERALSLRPDSYTAQSNLGAALEELSQFDEALMAYQHAAALKPDEIIAKWNMAFLYLRQGILDLGWEMHELRFDMKMALKRFPYSDWDGVFSKEKTILIYAEQGVGDEILFSSCIPDMIAGMGHCVIECDSRLAPLYTRSFPLATVVGAARDDASWLTSVPPIDIQSAGGSLPRFLRTTLQSFPSSPSYLVPDHVRVEFWRSRLAMLGNGLKVGICWRSGLAKGERKKGYSQLIQWGSILTTLGVKFVKLQYDKCDQELQEAEAKFGITITSFADIDLLSDLDDSAALMAALDLVISAPTAVSEIAAAVGAEVFRLDHNSKSWTALGDDRKMPWHPTIKLFAQPSEGDWETPIALIAEALKDKTLTNENAVEYAHLPQDVVLAVNSSLGDLPAYVLKEQGKWFDPEYEFILRLAQPGMQSVDVGAGVGVYAIPIAKISAGGKLWAITQTAAETNLLLQSRTRNKLWGNIGYSLINQEPLLDREMDRHGLDNIDFVRIAANFSCPDLLANGTKFFAANSPLIMFGIKPGEDAGFALAERFLEHAYDLYRLVPGLNLLVPFTSVAELDAYSLNLFACKPDRAELLERQGFLIRRFHTLDSFPGIDVSYWQEYLKAMPYAAGMPDAWSSEQQKEQDWEVYWMALNLFAMAKSEKRSNAERYACMQAAHDAMIALVKNHANIARILTLCRILTELGRREAAVNLLNQICDFLGSGADHLVNEPFLALTDSQALTTPGARLPEWIVATVLQQREFLRAFSSYFTGLESLPVLEEIQSSGFGDEEINRRIVLIRKRFEAT